MNRQVLITKVENGYLVSLGTSINSRLMIARELEEAGPEIKAYMEKPVTREEMEQYSMAAGALAQKIN